MKRMLKFGVIVFFIIALNIIFEYYKTEKVLLVGELIGFEVQNSNHGNNENDVMPTAYNELGTMSFIKEDSNEFVALGHSTSNENNNTEVQYNCYTIGERFISKSSDRSIGYVRGTMDKQTKIGSINKDTSYGIFGTVDNIEKLNYQEIETASRYKVQKGNANILINIDGQGLESFNVEITDIDYLDENMNIQIQITDGKLLEKTGGIIQGMSGTPLVQNGKLIGVVNYVENKNSKQAYAIFVDKLI